MQRISQIAIVFLAASSLALAQTPGWRHIGDPATAGQPAAQDQTSTATADPQDPEPVAQPNPQDQPAAASAPAPAPAPAPPPARISHPRPAYGLPPELTVKPGTYISVRINQALSTDHNQAGDPFTASLLQPLVVDGVVVAHRGQMVYGTVAEVAKQHSDKPSRLKLDLTSFTLADGTQVAAQTQLVAHQGSAAPADGATASTAGVLLTHSHPTIIYPGAALTFETTAPVAISTARAPQAFRYVGPEDYAQPAIESAAGSQPRARYYGPGYAYPYYAYPYPYYPYSIWGPQYGFGALIIGGRGWGWGWGGRW
jgi:hypothetical protein